MSALKLEDVMAAVESLTGEVRALRADLDALKEDVGAHNAEHVADIPAETLVMLAAAVTSYLGKRVRIRSARLARPANDAGRRGGGHRVGELETGRDIRDVVGRLHPHHLWPELQED